MLIDDPCPCGSARPYAACCGRLHRGEALAATPEELMRSRYAAFVRRDAAYLLATWHPRTRPADLGPLDDVVWLGLRVTGTEGGPDEQTGVVAFEARHDGGTLRERSRFERRAGRWLYVDRDVQDA